VSCVTKHPHVELETTHNSHSELSYLNVVVERLMQFIIHVEEAVHGSGFIHREELRGYQTHTALHFRSGGRAETKAVYHQRQVRHRRVDVVVLGSHLNVEVAGNSDVQLFSNSKRFSRASKE
jgi:hypothetical protein